MFLFTSLFVYRINLPSWIQDLCIPSHYNHIHKHNTHTCTYTHSITPKIQQHKFQWAYYSLIPTLIFLIITYDSWNPLIYYFKTLAVKLLRECRIFLGLASKFDLVSPLKHIFLIVTVLMVTNIEIFIYLSLLLHDFLSFIAREHCFKHRACKICFSFWKCRK
jgi:hypothetical protein